MEEQVREPTELTCPPSATHAGVAWSGTVAMLLGVVALKFWPTVQYIAYLVADRSAARLTHGNHVKPACSQGFREETHLGSFAAALWPFEGNKHIELPYPVVNKNY